MINLYEDDEEDFEEIDDNEEEDDEEQELQNQGEQLRKRAEAIKKIMQIARVLVADPTAIINLLKNPKNWLYILVAIVVVFFLLLAIIACVMLIVAAVIYFILGAGKKIKAAWLYFWEGTDSFVTEKMVEDIRKELVTKVSFEEIGYVGEKIFSEVGISPNSDDGTYTVSKDKYKGKVDIEGNIIDRYIWNESEEKNIETTTQGTIVNDKLDINSAMCLYIEQYLNAQAYSMNKYNGWTLSDNKGAITIKNNTDGLFQSSTGKDASGRLYANTNSGVKIYLDDIIDDFGMPWQFPFVFHEATLCPDLGWEIAQLAKKYHQLEVLIEEEKYYGERLTINEENEEEWVDFEEINYVTLITKKSTWFSVEETKYEKKVIEIEDTDTRRNQKKEVFEIKEHKYSEENKEDLKNLIKSDAKYYRENKLSEKDNLNFITSSDLVIEGLKRVYFTDAEEKTDTNEKYSEISKPTTDSMINEPIRNVMQVFAELDYLNVETTEINYDEYISYDSPIEDGLPSNWPREVEKYNNGYISFAVGSGKNVVSVAKGKILDKGANYITIQDLDNNFVIHYENLNLKNNINIGDEIDLKTVIGTTIDDALKIKVIDDMNMVTDPTSLFVAQGQILDGYIYYNQSSEPWGRLPYTTRNDPKQTYASSACGPTSLAMIIANIKHTTSVTPITVVNRILNEEGGKYRSYRTANTGTAYAIFTDSSFLSPFGINPGTTLGSDPAKAVQAAQNGKMVAIIQAHRSNNGGTSGHFLVFAPPPNGVSGMIYVLDPAKTSVCGLRTYANFVEVRKLVTYKNAWAFDIE